MKWQRWILRSIVLLLSLVLLSCAAGSSELESDSQAGSGLKEGAIATSNASIEASFPPSSQTAERTIALTSLSADILYQLDRTKLVGIVGSRLLTQDPRFNDLPLVSAGQTQPNLEKIVALKPDLVIGAKGFHDRILQKLQDLKIATLTVEMKSWQSLTDLTQILAQSIAADPTPLLERYQQCLADRPTQTPSTLLLASWQPILAPNKNSWAGDLLQKFNAQNLAADLQGKSPIGGYVTLSAEKILKANPDVIILIDIGDGSLNQFKSQAFWQQLQATQADRVYTFDYYGLVNPGSIEKIEQACTQLRQILSN